VPENLYPVLRGTEMKPNFVHLLENFLFADGAFRSELREIDALMIAKARQDLSHDKLDKWIAATIAELKDAKLAA
jgi:hypothetical protein